MQLCFIDESGTPAKLGQTTARYFVLGGLIIPEERWHKVAASLHGLKVSYGYQGEVKWRFFAPNNRQPINPMALWNQERKNEFREKLFRIITTDHSIKVIAGVCDCELAYELAHVNSQSDIYFQTYKVLTERFQYYLQDLQKESGAVFRGIIVADHRGHDDDRRLRIQHQRLVETDGINTARYKNLVEGLFLAPSHMSIGYNWRIWSLVQFGGNLTPMTATGLTE